MVIVSMQCRSVVVLQEVAYLLALWIVLKCQYIFRLIFEANF